MKKDIAALIGEISKVSMEINLNENNDCVFIDISGHVDLFRIYYCKNKDKYSDHTLEEEFYYGEGYQDEYLLRKLNKILNTLRHINKNGKVNYKKFNFDIEEVKHYKFY